MHPSLATHLHSECKEFIDVLNSCHDEHPYGKFFGKCNDAKLKMMKCLEKEDLKRRQQNRIKARENVEKTIRFRESLKESNERV
ncbi:COX assembly mitochondrial protein 2 homolog [Rhopilema esculentum]|uniref:COX assembly mitochondrial protein 2 homolog n=1 Tax=Rhopilema esculentum TaxID=499914 RepID=UPI0031D0219C